MAEVVKWTVSFLHPHEISNSDALYTCLYAYFKHVVSCFFNDMFILAYNLVRLYNLNYKLANI
jgi:hypothetical protein